MASDGRPLAIVTGASSGIGYELARQCAENGFDLLIAADEGAIVDTAEDFRALGGAVEAVEADLATIDGVERLYAATKGRPIEALLANAGRGLGKAFLDQDFDDIRHVIDTNVTGTIYLIHKVGRDMRAAQRAHPDHRIDRGLHAGDLPSRLQRDQGFSRQLLVRSAP
jgi:short-subunit dehydrogenase